MPRKAIIIGAGPAGLTAAYELLQRTDIVPVILEKSSDIGGISKTINYKGNRMDIGGHRFFSKSDRVMSWWLNILPIEPLSPTELTVTYQRKHKTIKSEEVFPRHSDSEPNDKVMLVRNRLSRIYFLRKFFAYPITLSVDTLLKLGLGRTISILLSYVRARLFPRKPEKSLEDFFINRFGDKLYRLFFKDYTEKVWGVPCTTISAEWGAQRIKGISIGKAILHAARSLKPKRKAEDIHQKGTETSLIEKFLYPKYGPGQLWEEVARQIEEKGGQILMNNEVTRIVTDGTQTTAIEARNHETSQSVTFEGDYFFSTMPVQELIANIREEIPDNVREVAEGLQYRDFITVGVLLKKLPEALPDTWIYIQERDVKVGRLQIFNNWSPYMVNDPNTVWVGMEYFCNQADTFWQQADETIKSKAIAELDKMGLAKKEDVLDSTVLRMEKTYPAYFGSYNRFEEVREFTDKFSNLFLIGRNGMHKYNNSDHSMLTAMVAVDNIVAGVTDKTNIWSINTEQEYHEEKATSNDQTNIQKPAAVPLTRRFGEFLLKDNRAALGFAAFAIVTQFLVFKYLYPQAGFIFGDSYIYLQSAYYNLSINTYPVGYSNFLRLFSVFTYSDTALVAFQYLLLECSSLLFIFTICYFYRQAKWTRITAFCFALLNPVWLYLANYISSDALFIGLSIVWFTLLIWLLERPNSKLLVAQVFLLYFLFSIRYNALYYPLITALCLLLTRKSWRWKSAGIAASFLAIALFIWHTSSSYEEQTGKRIFSPFSGWQLANNAMYAYRYVDSSSRKKAPQQFETIDKMVRHYFDTTRDTKNHPIETLQANTFYMWDPTTPLRQYMALKFKDSSPVSSLKKWASVAPLYSEYGSWLIKTYPKEFFTYYLWPNALKYYAPPVEFLNTYNMGRDSIAEFGRYWFHFPNNKIRIRAKDQKVAVLDFYPILSGMLNVIFIISFLFFSLLGGFRENRHLSKGLFLMSSLWVINFGFSVFASPVALRFQLFPVLVSFSFSLFLLEFIIRKAFTTKPTAKKAQSVDFQLSNS